MQFRKFTRICLSAHVHCSTCYPINVHSGFSSKNRKMCSCRGVRVKKGSGRGRGRGRGRGSRGGVRVCVCVCVCVSGGGEVRMHKEIIISLFLKHDNLNSLPIYKTKHPLLTCLFPSLPFIILLLLLKF